MRLTTILLIVSALMTLAYMTARQRALAGVGGPSNIGRLHSLPAYYGYYAAICCGLPAVMLLLVWLTASEALITSRLVASLPEAMQSLPDAELSLLVNDVKNLASGNIVAGDKSEELEAAAQTYLAIKSSGRWWLSALALALALGGLGLALRRVKPQFRARNKVESMVMVGLILASTVAIFTTIGILLSVLFEAIRFFQQISVADFVFGLNWSPQTAIRADQVGSSGSFGAVPLFVGTLLISAIAMAVAVPLGLMIAIYLSEYAAARARQVIKPTLEILAGIPTVVYGYFAALTVAPWLRGLGEALGLDVASESALGAGLVMGVMILPFVSSLSDDVINAVPQSLRDGSYGLGATRSETVRRVILPAALPGIVGGVLLAVSRAIGETMIVVMAAGLAANLTINPLQAVTTVTVQIVTLLVGDQEFDSAKTLAAFALGLMLFVVTLGLNVIALHVVRKYREEYE